MSNMTPIVPLPEGPGDETAENTATREEDGKRKLDPDAADDLIESADADRIAAETGDATADEDDPRTRE